MLILSITENGEESLVFLVMTILGEYIQLKCLEAQQSMAKQPIKGCVSNHSRTCGKSVSEKSE